MTTRPTTTQRGYGSDHQQLRQSLADKVASGHARCTELICLMPTRTIRPDEPWDLAHGDTRSTYRGPAHARCNRAEAGRRSHRPRHRRPATGSSYPIALDHGHR